jgi:hypothetical protein
MEEITFHASRFNPQTGPALAGCHSSACVLQSEHMADKKDELQAKLRRLGVVKGARDLKPARELKPAPPVDEELIRPFSSLPPPALPR